MSLSVLRMVLLCCYDWTDWTDWEGPVDREGPVDWEGGDQLTGRGPVHREGTS